MPRRLPALLCVFLLLAGCARAPHFAEAAPASGPHQEPDGIVGKYWKLMTLEGNPVRMLPGQEREAYFILRDSSQLTGFGGCNALRGRYTLSPGRNIHFANLLTTRKACPSLEPEGALLRVLNQANTYTLLGDTLRLHSGRRATLAEFHAVYF